PSVRVVLSAGEALPVDLFDGFRRRFGLPLLDGLGATEALHHVTSNRVDDVVPGSAGRPLDGYEARALDSDHQPVPDGENGELSRELTRLCRERLAAFKVPRSFEVVDELPRTATGKLRRFVLRGGRPAG